MKQLLIISLFVQIGLTNCSDPLEEAVINNEAQKVNEILQTGYKFQPGEGKSLLDSAIRGPRLEIFKDLMVHNALQYSLHAPLDTKASLLKIAAFHGVEDFPSAYYSHFKGNLNLEYLLSLGWGKNVITQAVNELARYVHDEGIGYYHADGVALLLAARYTQDAKQQRQIANMALDRLYKTPESSDIAAFEQIAAAVLAVHYTQDTELQRKIIDRASHRFYDALHRFHDALESSKGCEEFEKILSSVEEEMKLFLKQQ